MKILYDYQILRSQKYGGISRYFYDLISTINNKQLAETDIRCLFSQNKYFNGKLSNVFRKDIANFPGKGFINRIYYKIVLRTCDYDIFHPTYYNPYFCKAVRGKVVITVYDMIYELMPEYFQGADVIIKMKQKAIHVADHIIAISESTKEDILKIYPDIAPDRITVIYIGSKFKKLESDINLDFPQNYILFVGKRNAYKNYVSFFKAMIPIFEVNNDIKVVCLGGGDFANDELELHGKYNDRVIQLDVNDEILSYAYSHAKCFVFPSLYEGFGIPTLEAFACDCPVILSNTSSMPEVGGDAAEYVNPYDVEDISQKISMVLNDDEMRSNMIKKGREQLKKFNWDEIAKLTVDCYKKVLEDE